jgi:hypothetical protein
MNPFLAFLLIAPMIISLVLIVGTIRGMILHGFRVDIAAAFFIASGLFSYLLLVFKEMWISSSKTIEISEREHLPESFRRKFTNQTIGITYLILGTALVILLGYDSIRGLIAPVCFALGLTLMVSGFVSMRNQDEGKSSIFMEFTKDESQFLQFLLARYSKWNVYVFVMVSGLACAAVWHFYFGEGPLQLSLWELLSLLFLLASTAIWFFLYGIRLRRFFHGKAE